MEARIISQTNTRMERLCRLQLASGEKVFIKLILGPTCFLGIWEIGSLNPVTIGIDWITSKFTGIRTAGFVQLWGLGEDTVRDIERWQLIIQTMFNHQGDNHSILETVIDRIKTCYSVNDLRQKLAFWQKSIYS